MVEHFIRNEGVIGSSPIVGSRRSLAAIAVEEIIRRAIEDRAPLSLRYETTGGATRTVHPQVLFRAANGTLCLDCYQVGGATSSDEGIPGWRQLDLDKITAIEVLNGSFRPAPGLNLDAERYAAGMIAHL